jgi:hypothetical protein
VPLRRRRAGKTSVQLLPKHHRLNGRVPLMPRRVPLVGIRDVEDCCFGEGLSNNLQTDWEAARVKSARA